MIWTEKIIIKHNKSLQEHDHVYVITNFCRSEPSAAESTAVKNILNNYLDGEYSFRRSLHGRPYLVSDSKDVPLFISIAHSKNVLALAISLDEAIGIDVEVPKPRSHTNLIAKRYFGHGHEGLSPYSFYHHWCAREAFIKAIDGRLFRDLSAIKTEENEHYLIGTKSLDHCVTFFEPAQHYIGALCRHMNSKKGLLVRSSHPQI